MNFSDTEFTSVINESMLKELALSSTSDHLSIIKNKSDLKKHLSNKSFSILQLCKIIRDHSLCMYLILYLLIYNISATSIVCELTTSCFALEIRLLCNFTLSKQLINFKSQ